MLCYNFSVVKYGGCSSTAERHTVDVDVVGSKPISRPISALFGGRFYFSINGLKLVRGCLAFVR